MGHEIGPDSILATMERVINYKYLTVTMEKMGDIIEKSQKKIERMNQEGPERKISSIAEGNLLKSEMARFEILKSRYTSFQDSGFRLDEIKTKIKNMDKEMEIKLEQLKRESFLFRVSAFLNPSLNNLTVHDLFREKKEKKNSNE